MKPIGRIHSEFPEKFGVPKQPGLAPALKAVLVLEGEWAHETCWRGLEQCSHIWVIFEFHLNGPSKNATVRPPVLGGEKRMGVFSTRSPHRPNPLGLSLVKLETVEVNGKEAHLHVSGHDFVNGTPLLDIKPYVPSYDVPRGDVFHWSDELPPVGLHVRWEVPPPEGLGPAIEQVLRLDPRPRSSKEDARFGMAFAGYNVVFGHDGEGVVVREITKVVP